MLTESFSVMSISFLRSFRTITSSDVSLPSSFTLEGARYCTLKQVNAQSRGSPLSSGGGGDCMIFQGRRRASESGSIKWLIMNKTLPFYGRLLSVCLITNSVLTDGPQKQQKYIFADLIFLEYYCYIFDDSKNITVR